MKESDKIFFKNVCSLLDLFQGRLSFTELMNLPIPVLDDLRDGQIDYLKEKRKAEQEILKSGKQ